MAARVGGTTISSHRVDAVLDHARAEANREGRPFPAKGSPGYDALRRQALDFLVYHEELAQRAARLGIVVAATDVAQPAGNPQFEVPGSEGDPFSVFGLESRREAALYRKVYERVTRDVRVAPAQVSAYIRQHPGTAAPRGQIRRNLLDTQKNTRMANWIAAMRREYEGKIEYGPAFRAP